MATAKIATLAIRTLAKPIATQIKHQAQNHQRFRTICIGLAQFMHRTEMALRTNLLASPSSTKDGEKQKIRPLNEAKAVTNGANALAEGFLFALATALIIGESYRGSRSRAKQRDRTEEGLDELRLITQTIAERVGVDFDKIMERVHEIEAEKKGSDEFDDEDDAEKKEHKKQASLLQSLYKQRQDMEKERDRLQHAVNVLLRLALKSGWIQGAEALHLQKILDGTDEHSKEEEESTNSQKAHIPDQTKEQTATAPNNKDDITITTQSPILTQLAQLQARQ
ncbi:OPA3-domain-containing protein [Meira miltonrushii]|uniref:OPA3-domain-containing protein n=1 Tax=Meira miltonrushii TaxID=1280837 RepID=A0A316V145_9BASI|nr:OPA3-domain-containing protein [Meira miltonrushii]PWN31277.1 OPA3-domain-containing protein [Meira miltonrushii]